MDRINSIDLVKGLNYYFARKGGAYGTFIGIEDKFVMFKPIVIENYKTYEGNVEFPESVDFLMCETEKQNSHANTL